MESRVERQYCPIFVLRKCTGKRDITLQNYLFRKTLNFSLPKKLDLRKTTFFAIGPVVFSPHMRKELSSTRAQNTGQRVLEIIYLQ
jgi:hypothetical protein